MGIKYYQPWLVVMTDGQDNGSREELTRARQRVQQLVGDRKLTIYPFFIGGEDNSETAEGMETLASISPKQKPILIETQQMAGLFEWLGKSVVAMSSGDLDGQEAICRMHRRLQTAPGRGLLAGGGLREAVQRRQSPADERRKSFVVP